MTDAAAAPPIRPAARAESAGLVRYWYPLIALVRRDLQRRYATTVLGLGWTVLQPLVLIGVYFLVFGFILKAGQPGDSRHAFSFFMLSGMLPYLATTDGIQRAASALREDRVLLDRESFPAEVIPAARVVGATVAEVGALGLFVLVGAFFTVPITGWLLLLPLLVGVRIAITFGYAWLVSILTIFVTDLAEVLSLLLTAWLFLTPIFYHAEAVPPGLRWLLVLNPLHHVVEAYRAVLLDGRAPFPAGVFAIGWVIVVGGVGLWFFRKALDRAKDFI